MGDYSLLHPHETEIEVQTILAHKMEVITMPLEYVELRPQLWKMLLTLLDLWVKSISW